MLPWLLILAILAVVSFFILIFSEPPEPSERERLQALTRRNTNYNRHVGELTSHLSPPTAPSPIATSPLVPARPAPASQQRPLVHSLPLPPPRFLPHNIWTFGVEIELVILPKARSLFGRRGDSDKFRRKLQSRLRKNGLDAVVCEPHEAQYGLWSITSDGSLRANAREGECENLSQ